PAYTNRAIESILRGTARAFPGTCSQCGTGIVDATAALAAIASPTWVPITNSSGVVQPAYTSLYWSQTTCMPFPTPFCTYRLFASYGDLWPIWYIYIPCSGSTTYPAGENGYRRVGTTCQIEAMSVVIGK